MYCSKGCADSDWSRHRADCQASREGRALYEAAKETQRLYYTACEMDLDFAVDNGVRVGTEDKYEFEPLQRRMDAVRRNQQFSSAFLACCGGYNPILNRLNEMTEHLEGE